MVVINVNEYRKDPIKLYGLNNMDKDYTFYYDETNNGRKFHLEDGKFNIAIDQNFILGGVVHKEKNSEVNPEELFRKLNLQKTIKEVKLKHIVKGDFINVLKSEKVNQILNWTYFSNLYLHYTNLNPLYYGVVDIVDSAIVSSGTLNAFNMEYVNNMKNEVYLALNENINETEEIFFKYGYPSIEKDKIEEFIEDILKILEPYRNSAGRHLWIETAIQILKVARKEKSLPFIEEETKLVLMQDYSQFYARPLYMFKNSTHYFDKEDQIEKKLSEDEFWDSQRKLDHYYFINSQSNYFIQLSDVLMGIIGKLQGFIRQNALKDIKKMLSGLEELERENLDLLSKLVWKSHVECKGFLLKITSKDEKGKESLLSL